LLVEVLKALGHSLSRSPCDRFVSTEFFAIVHRQAADLAYKRPQFHDDRRSDFIGLLAVKGVHQQVPTLAFDQSYQKALMACAFNQIDFPVSIIKALLNNRRTFFYADTVLYSSASILLSESFSALLSALAQVLVEAAPAAIVSVNINMLVNTFMADSRSLWRRITPVTCSGLRSSLRYTSILPCIAGVNLILLRLEKRRCSALRCACLCR
jgi:hypothetical protein